MAFKIRTALNDGKKERRGSLRYYPAKAIESHNYYVPEFDVYMVTFVIYEMITNHEPYAECKSDIAQILYNRKNKIFPIWDIAEKKKKYIRTY